MANKKPAANEGKAKIDTKAPSNASPKKGAKLDDSALDKVAGGGDRRGSQTPSGYNRPR